MRAFAYCDLMAAVFAWLAVTGACFAVTRVSAALERVSAVIHQDAAVKLGDHLDALTQTSNIPVGFDFLVVLAKQPTIDAAAQSLY